MISNVDPSDIIYCQFTESLVIVKKSSPKNLSADCRSTVGRQLTDRLPTVYRQLTNRLPTGYEKRKIVVNTSS